MKSHTQIGLHDVGLRLDSFLMPVFRKTVQL